MYMAPYVDRVLGVQQIAWVRRVLFFKEKLDNVVDVVGRSAETGRNI
jgi:hypothetical protein